MNDGPEEPTLSIIAARACSLQERIEGWVVPAPEPNASVAEGLVARWAELLRGRPRLARRLAIEGLEEDRCRAVLGDVRLAPGRSTPAWTRELLEIISLAGPGRLPPSDRALSKDAPIAFEEVLAPFLVFARDRLRTEAGPALLRFSDRALGALERQLLAALSDLAARPLLVAFRAHIAESDPLALLTRTPSAPEPPAVDQYGDFVEGMATSAGLSSFFAEYAVLARLMVGVIDRWVAASAELAARLLADISTIADTFKVSDPGPVREMVPGLSDPHRGGRSVARLTFESGLELIYKPKPVAHERALSDLLRWLAPRLAQQGLPALRSLTVIARDGYGWVEPAHHSALPDESEIDRYFLRAGLLLGLVHVLEGTDCHSQNLIASGEHPVLVDAETLLYPRIRPWSERDQSSAREVAAHSFDKTPLRTGLLPIWSGASRGKLRDVSGFCDEGGHPPGPPEPFFENVNTDRMQVEMRGTPAPERQNLPYLGIRKLTAADHAEQVSRGFGAMLRLLAASRAELTAEGGPLEAFAVLRTRFIFRHTATYVRLLRRLRAPRLLQDGAARSIEIEALAEPMLAEDGGPPWALFVAEREALERLDVPVLEVDARSTDLICEGRLVARDAFYEPAIARVEGHLGALDEGELAAQLAYVRAALVVRSGRQEPRPGQDVEPDPLWADQPIPAPAALLDAAVRIGEQIRSHAMRGADGSAAWIGFGVDPRIELMQLQPLGADLYHGRAGVALFLGALERAKPGHGFGELARAALSSLRGALRGPHEDRALAGLDLGAATGIGGLVYVLVRLARSLDDPSLIEDALHLCSRIDEKRLSADKRHDVVSGAAGAVLGLVALHDASGDRRPLERAIEAARALLDARVTSESGHRVWITSPGDPPRAGFAHGAAGIACALLRLHEKSGERSFVEAAEEALRYEAAIYSERNRNWPVLESASSSGKPERWAIAWCHGATGVGFSRLDALAVLETKPIHDQLAIALATTEASSSRGLDHVCCGNFGRLELLLEVGRRRGRAELVDAARRRAGWLIQRASLRGGYAFGDDPGRVPNLSFFRGSAGVGYGLLRLADPALYPCVLLFD